MVLRDTPQLHATCITKPIGQERRCIYDVQISIHAVRLCTPTVPQLTRYRKASSRDNAPLHRSPSEAFKSVGYGGGQGTSSAPMPRRRIEDILSPDILFCLLSPFSRAPFTTSGAIRATRPAGPDHLHRWQHLISTPSTRPSSSQTNPQRPEVQSSTDQTAVHRDDSAELCLPFPIRLRVCARRVPRTLSVRVWWSGESRSLASSPLIMSPGIEGSAVA
ncbi:hypothetical protein C8Q74DRAFT_319903 [Fomes fomentarius]|nr:hypothetical protein C8Q74DRAFT_319903 [Fomes fomentarius]